MIQVALFDGFCPCGAEAETAGRCCRCYAREWRDRRRFGGNRERAIRRDRGRCQGCGGAAWIIVHHRARRNGMKFLITLCAGCHARIHHLKANRYLLPPALLTMWIELHPGMPVQLPLEMPAPIALPLAA